MPGDPYSIDNERALDALIGEPLPFIRAKIENKLDEPMKEFVRCSPLIFVSTITAEGHVDISPKGDPAGFVQIDSNGNLLIPERPGNRLAFGFRNILHNREIGLILVVPRQRETLRIKGLGSLRSDPSVLATMKANQKPALLYTHVEVKECFFHCGKALIRSEVWQPEAWAVEPHAIAAQNFAKLRIPGDGKLRLTEAVLEQSYRNDLY
jgi:PPOX class probable FMN-dependent enzyme